MTQTMDPASTPIASEPNGSARVGILADRLAGVLLGTALGDALGLPAEGMTARAIARRFGRVERFRLLGHTGYVSDDTEQAALVAQSLVRFPEDAERCTSDFRRALLGWFYRVPWGVGLATVRACLRMTIGQRRSGVMSAGNGAAMRAAVIGAFFFDQAEERRRFGLALAEVTHRDPRAVEGALYVAELAALCVSQGEGNPASLAADARRVVSELTLRAALERAEALAQEGADAARAAVALGTSGFILHTVPFALYCFLRYGDDPLKALVEAVSAGGDTDSVGAIVGAWLGARHGESGLPAQLLRQIHDGPFGPTHLRALGCCLARLRGGERTPAPGYSPAAALIRNVLLLPVILAHGFRRLLPF